MDGIKFLPKEQVLMSLYPAKILMYSWFGSSYYWTKGVIVTNKRIIISFQWFGYESFRRGISYYYNSGDYNIHRKSLGLGASRIFNHSLGKGRFLGDFLKLIVTRKSGKVKIKIYTNRNKEIEQIIKQNTK